MDTAGLRESTDDIERMGMERARSAMTTADIIAIVLDLQSEPELAAVLQQQQHNSASAHDNGLGAQDEVIAVGRRLIKEVVGPDNPEHSTRDPAGEQQRGPDLIGQRMIVEEQDSDSAVSRPQHQKTLLVLNKSDLQPLSQQLPGLTGPSQCPPDTSQDRSNGACAAELSTDPCLQTDGRSASGAGSCQPVDLLPPEADAVGHEQSKKQAEGAAGDMVGAVATSCRTGEGLDRLLARLSEVVAEITQAGDADGAIITRCCQLPVMACSSCTCYWGPNILPEVEG